MLNILINFIISLSDLPIDQIEQSSHVAMLITARGGHIGFMDGLLPKWGSQYYLERLLDQYLKALQSVEDVRKFI